MPPPLPLQHATILQTTAHLFLNGERCKAIDVDWATFVFNIKIQFHFQKFWVDREGKNRERERKRAKGGGRRMKKYENKRSMVRMCWNKEHLINKMERGVGKREKKEENVC